MSKEIVGTDTYGSITTEYLKAQNGAEIGNTDTISVTATYRGPTDYREIIVGTGLTNAISMYSMVKRISGV